jgi:hypothetical protein
MIKFIIIILELLIILYLYQYNKEYLTEQEGKDLKDFASKLKQTNKPQSYLRKENVPIKCDSDSEIYDDYCYKKCKEGYEGIGVRCYNKCPSSMKSINEFCLKSEPKYMKQYNNSEECLKENQSCSMYAGDYISACSDNKENTNYFCTDKCSNNMLDVGFGCMKQSYFRKVDEETENTCPPDLERIGDRCYQKCAEGYKSNGKFCILEKNNII